MNNRHTLLLGLVTLTISLLSPSYIVQLYNNLAESGSIIFWGNHLQNAEAEFTIMILVIACIASLLITLKSLGFLCIHCHYKDRHF